MLISTDRQNLKTNTLIEPAQGMGNIAGLTCFKNPTVLCRPTSRALSCHSPQPFAASSLTARQVQKLRQAQQDAEIAPCTFRPSLDPHSLALVARLVSQLRCSCV